LRAPALALGNIPAAWDAMRAVNVVAFVSAAVPAYLVAREIVDSRRLAVVAALTCVFVPWIAITGSLLTEGIGYPAFIWAIAAMYFGLTRPGWRTDLLAVAGIGLAAGARSQQIVLLPAYAGAVIAHTGGWALRNRAAWRELVIDAARRHVVMLGTVVALALFAAT